MATKVSAQDRAEAIEILRKMLPRGSYVYTTVTHVARSGMMRRIALFIVVRGEIVRISGLVGRATGIAHHADDGALTVRGGGMDMCWHTVNALSVALYGDEQAPCLTQRGL